MADDNYYEFPKQARRRRFCMPSLERVTRAFLFLAALALVIEADIWLGARL